MHAVSWPHRLAAAALAAASMSAWTAVPVAETADLVEFYHATLDHYFVTIAPAEIADLDSGKHPGWARTGRGFPVVRTGSTLAGSVPVCRFYGRPEKGIDSHFYSAKAAECDDVRIKFADAWVFETAEAFRAFLANPDGACPADTVAVTRLWNARADVNHRYTDQPSLLAEMTARGYVPEGDGNPAFPVAFCRPVPEPGGGGGAELVTAPARPWNLQVTGDGARSVEAVIDAAGGRLEVVNAAGDRFALSIPAGALYTDTLIRMTPTAAVAGLPAGAGPFAGVLLEPDGLELAATARLEVVLNGRVVAAADRLHWGFHGTGGDAYLHVPEPSTGIAIQIDHFSGAGVGLADRFNLTVDLLRQRRVEDRMSTQTHELVRAVSAGDPTGDKARALGEFLNGEAWRNVVLGWRSLAERPAAGCAETAAAARSIIALKRQRDLLGLAGDNDERETMERIRDRYWDVCFAEQVQMCLASGDLPRLTRFFVKYQRMIALLGGGNTIDAATNGRFEQVVNALERCGRFKLAVDASGDWEDPSGVNGVLRFRSDVPVRMTVTVRTFAGFSYYLEGEAPPTNLTVTFNDPECWTLQGYSPGEPMLARVVDYQFTQEDRDGAPNAPKALTLRMRAPGVDASIACKGTTLSAEISPMVWAVAHYRERTGSAYKVEQFKTGTHPTLFTKTWEGRGAEDGLRAGDTTRLELEHIGQ